MMYKKQIYRSIAVGLVFITLVVAAWPALAASQTVNVFKVTFNQPITVYRGRGGVSFPKPQFSGMVGISNANVPSVGGAGIRWIGSFAYAIQLPSGTTAPYSNYQATVFFNLTKGWEVRAWNNQTLAIYFADVGGWKKLTTYAVGTRLAAASMGPGTYALGMSQPQVHPAP
jgi:hypothetical protein